MDINLSYLIVEGTRRCNMKCPHCLRGAAQRVDMDTRIANIVTRQLNSIFCITFTGGEPSLNSEIIKEFQYGFMFNDCSIGRFWVTTNARFYKEDFANALENKKEMCYTTVIHKQSRKLRAFSAGWTGSCHSDECNG